MTNAEKTGASSNAPPAYEEATEFAPGFSKEYPADIKTPPSPTEELAEALPERPGYSFYSVDFAKNSYHLDYMIKDATGKPLYYVDNKMMVSTFRGGKPDVVVHEGGDTKGPILFASRSNMIGTKHEVCFGDPDTSDKYTDLHLKNLVSLTTTWSPPGSTKKYTWQRIYGKEAEAFGGRGRSLLTLKLTDTETGDVVATYLNDGFQTWRKAGTYQIKANPEFGAEWDKYVMFTCGVLQEKERRARRWAYGSGHGGQ